MQTIDAVLFDLDGTLVDTAPDFVFVLNQLRQQYGLDALPDLSIRQQVSNGAKALIRLSFGDENTNQDFQHQLDTLLNLYEQHLAVKSAVFAGLETALKHLEQRSIPWGIVTNKPSRFTNPLVKGLNLEHRCAVAICPDQVNNSKPHPEPILTACNIIGARPENTLYVGDHLRDIQAGKNASNTTVAAAWGYLNEGEHAEDWQADIIMATPNDFSQWILELIP